MSTAVQIIVWNRVSFQWWTTSSQPFSLPSWYTESVLQIPPGRQADMLKFGRAKGLWMRSVGCFGMTSVKSMAATAAPPMLRIWRVPTLELRFDARVILFFVCMRPAFNLILGQQIAFQSFSATVKLLRSLRSWSSPKPWKGSWLHCFKC